MPVCGRQCVVILFRAKVRIPLLFGYSEVVYENHWFWFYERNLPFKLYLSGLLLQLLVSGAHFLCLGCSASLLDVLVVILTFSLLIPIDQLPVSSCLSLLFYGF